ncbi:MAG: DUF4430 domain-containing protein [Candidatus Brocadiales bacterium]|nr:DUF4430 domain-containing protein [Candidatus Brocadiales bacterium]
MKNTIKIIIAFVFLIVLCVEVYAGESVNVGIDYGDARESRGTEAQWQEGVTALEALQSVAEVETHQVGEYVFVTSIDGIKGKRGDKAWYYEINGKHADKLAFARVLNRNENTRWIYKKDVCSPKVDK